MQVRLKILQGSHAGKEIKIPVPKCVIGRGEDCHLRPQSEAVSRRHCVIITTDNEVVVRDLNSRNGTFVNDERVGEEAVLLHGDILRVGPLQFEMIIEHTPGKAKRPKVADIKDAVTRTAEGSSAATADLGDVTQWLEEDAGAARSELDPETRQFRLDDTVQPVKQEAGSTSDTKTLSPGSGKQEAKGPGKLPPRPATQMKDSREAAAEMLRKFFNRR
jgi:predicted component of type VI protein secretion system